jgi:hypothetical protein
VQEQGRVRNLRVLLLIPFDARISSTVIAPIWPVKLGRRREIIDSRDVFTACRPSGPGTKSNGKLSSRSRARAHAYTTSTLP